jgi:hypothetical protein
MKFVDREIGLVSETNVQVAQHHHVDMLDFEGLSSLGGQERAQRCAEYEPDCCSHGRWFSYGFDFHE